MAIFVSYRRADSAEVVGRIIDHLAECFGRDAIFLDVENIPPGADGRAVIRRRLATCRYCLVVIGNGWVTAEGESGRRRLDNPDDYVRLEVELALEGAGETAVIPVLVSGAKMPSRAQLPRSLQDLADRNAVRVRADPDFRNDVDRLIVALGGRPRSQAARWLVGALVAAGAVQVGLFAVSAEESVRMLGVLVPNAVGVGVGVLGAVRRRRGEVLLGVLAVAAPWLLRLLAEPMAAVAAAAALTTAVAVVVTRRG